MAAIIAYFSRRGENYVSGKLKELSVGNTEVAAGCSSVDGGGPVSAGAGPRVPEKL